MSTDASPQAQPRISLPARIRAAALRPTWRRALGEFVLIVVGVLVALAVNNWNATRDRRRAELVVLRSIRGALADDLTLLQDADTGYRKREERIVALLRHIAARGAYADSLRAAFGAIYGYWPLSLNRAPYEALKASDLSLVSNDSLRGAIVDLYERVYGRLADALEVERNAAQEVLRPYFLREFYDLRFREGATPRNYAAVVRDPYFLNLAEYRLTMLRVNPLAATRTAIPAMQALIQRIDEALVAR